MGSVRGKSPPLELTGSRRKRRQEGSPAREQTPYGRLRHGVIGTLCIRQAQEHVGIEEPAHLIVEVLPAQRLSRDGGPPTFRQSGHPFMEGASPVAGRQSLPARVSFGNQAQNPPFLFQPKPGMRTGA
jgi:hypothetical protein